MSSDAVAELRRVTAREGGEHRQGGGTEVLRAPLVVLSSLDGGDDVLVEEVEELLDVAVHHALEERPRGRQLHPQVHGGAPVVEGGPAASDVLRDIFAVELAVERGGEGAGGVQDLARLAKNPLGELVQLDQEERVQRRLLLGVHTPEPALQVQGEVEGDVRTLDGLATVF